ncbi:MAG: ATP-binding cassette domain-containing protein, partial [Gammaproteobacteria bacterium]|nr:ATP-binding cassette domain-containing protein [Gammaproteobacteria bacterium]
MLSFKNTSLRRGIKLLVSDATFTIHRGNKVGLVGANGSGKSSLLQLVLGELETEGGSIDLAANTRIAHMDQEVPTTDEPAINFVLAGDSAYVDVINSLESADDHEIAEL